MINAIILHKLLCCLLVFIYVWGENLGFSVWSFVLLRIQLSICMYGTERAQITTLQAQSNADKTNTKRSQN